MALGNETFGPSCTAYISRIMHEDLDYKGKKDVIEREVEIFTWARS